MYTMVITTDAAPHVQLLETLWLLQQSLTEACKHAGLNRWAQGSAASDPVPT